MNKDSRAVFRLAISAYLIYLAYDFIKMQQQGNSGVSPVLTWGAAVIFGLLGLGIGIYSIIEYDKQWRREKKEKEAEKAQEQEQGDAWKN